MKRTFLLLILSFPWYLKSQPLPVIDKNDFSGIKSFTSRTYNGESLYGYIDGGADLYLEYGFSGVTVSEFVLDNSRFKVEVYRMKGPEEAYGIYSVSKFRCRNRPGFTQYTCQNRYQLQVCAGQYYLNIINSNGSSADSAISVTIGEKLVGKASLKPPQINDSFSPADQTLPSGEPFLVKGRLGAMNAVPELENYFKDADGLTAMIFPGEKSWLLLIRFNSPEQLIKYCSMMGWKNPDNSATLFNSISVSRKSDLLLSVEIPR